MRSLIVVVMRQFKTKYTSYEISKKNQCTAIPVKPYLAHVLRHVRSLVLPRRHPPVPVAVALHQVRVVKGGDVFVDVDAHDIAVSSSCGSRCF